MLVKTVIATLLLGAATIGVRAESAKELYERIPPSSTLSALSASPEKFERTMLKVYNRLRGENDFWAIQSINVKSQFDEGWKIADRLRLVGFADLNHDGNVDPDEIGLAIEAVPLRENGFDKLLPDVDTNADGTMQRQEIVEYIAQFAKTHRMVFGQTGLELLYFDVNGDFVVTAEEISAYTQSVAALLRNQPGAEPFCILPDFDPTTEFHMFLVESTNLINDAGQPEVILTTKFSYSSPLVLAISRDPVVWRFEGDPDLIAGLVVTNDVIGVIGLPDSKVIRVPKTACTTYNGEDRLSHASYLRLGRIGATFGKKPDEIDDYLADDSIIKIR